MSDPDHLSPRRHLRSSFDRCYAVGIQRRMHSGVNQFILRTGNPLQPFRTTSRAPKRDERLLHRILLGRSLSQLVSAAFGVVCEGR